MKELAINGYPRWAYDLARHRKTHTTMAESTAVPTATLQPPSPPPPPPPSARHKGFISLPYYSGTKEPLTHIMRQAGISAQIRSRGTLRECLIKSKDKIKNNNKTGVVYYAPCAGANDQPCDQKASYVGETSRQGSQPLKEHKSTAKLYNRKYKSAIMQYAADTGHSFRETDISILK